jgi:RNA:NAD 2'-phosphotransferase (TPT1/KptA family)
MRADGFIYLTDLLAVKSLQRMRIGEDQVEQIVNNNDKKRFELAVEQGVKLIRAV